MNDEAAIFSLADAVYNTYEEKACKVADRAKQDEDQKGAKPIAYPEEI